MAVFLVPSVSVSTPASNSEAMSPSSSVSGQESRHLSFRGQIVRIVIPTDIPESTKSDEDILEKVLDIHQRDEEDVILPIKIKTNDSIMLL